MPWRKTLVTLPATIRDAIAAIQKGELQVCLVVDGDGRLAGTITDGDIRRGLLKGLDLQAPVESVMNTSPNVAKEESSGEELLCQMTAGEFKQIPLLDKKERLVGLAHIDDLIAPVEFRENWVVLMAGGLGSRLQPLTEYKPKPLLFVGDKPILETILESFVEQNFRKFYISVNYKADAIKKHFADGGKWNAEIRYLEEDKRLGTAGALDLIPERPELPLLIMNGDLLTRVNFQDLLDYHHDQKAQATMCVRKYDFQVPFGVVEIDDHHIRRIDEKPVHRFFVNAGIYVLEPGLIDLIPKGEYFDMTDLFARALEKEYETQAFPIHEYWLDVGRIDDLDRANHDYENGLDI